MDSRQQRLLIAAVLSGLLLAMLDQTIVGTALPRIVRDLGGADLYIWLVTAYLVPATVSVPVYARLSDRHGRRALLVTGMVLFLAGSALAATAQEMWQLIGWRALQGLGAGALEGLSFILVADLFAGRRNTALQGALAGLMGVSFLAGPLIGGLPHRPRRLALGVPRQPADRARRARRCRLRAARLDIGRSERGAPVDVRGIALLTLSVGLVLVGLSVRSHAGADGILPGWLEPRTGGLIAAGLAILAAFVAAERRAASPVVPLGLLTDRRTGALLLAAATGAFGLFAGALLLPLYFQNVRHVSATHSGLLIYPLLLGLVVSVNAGGMAIARSGEFRQVILAATGLLALGGLGFATFDAATPGWESFLFMLLTGAGVGPLLSGLQIALQRTVSPRAIGGAMGVLMLLRQVGASLALTVAASLYASGRQGGASAAAATGDAVCVVALVGVAVAAGALLSLPRGARRFAPAPVPAH